MYVNLLGALVALASMGRAGDLPEGNEPVSLDPADYTTRIDNRYSPMTPRTSWTYRETDEAGADLRVAVRGSGDRRRLANGVTVRMLRNRSADGRQLVEDT